LPKKQDQRYISRQVNGGQREAERVEARLKTEVADGRHAGTRAQRFGELLDMWLEWRQTNGKPISPTTLNNYRARSRPRSGQPSGRCPSTALTPAPWTASTGSSGRAETPVRTAGRTARPKTSGGQLSASRIRDVHAIISGALGLAARWGWLPHNPAVLASPRPHAMPSGPCRPWASWASCWRPSLTIRSSSCTFGLP
jgi:integrase